MKKTLLTMAVASLCLAACSTKEAEKEVIGKPNVPVVDGRFTPEVMWSLGVMSEYAVSPDGSQVVYTLRYTDMEQNKNNTELYLMPAKGGEATRLTTTAASEFSPVWYDQNTLMFCRDTQIVSMNVNDMKESVVAECSRGFEGFKVAPDGKSLVYISTIPVERPENIEKLYAGLDKTTGRINENLMYRHWDNWVDEIPHIYYAPVENGKAMMDKAKDILEGEPFETPMRPWGGTEQYNYSPDSKTIAYTCRKKTGYEYAHSTNSDIYLYNVETGETRNISEGIMGYDQNPVFSHDGKMIAWESMERDGYEADKLRLMVMDLASGTKVDLTENFDYGVSNIYWTNDDKELVAVVMYQGTLELFAFNRETIRKSLCSILPLSMLTTSAMTRSRVRNFPPSMTMSFRRSAWARWNPTGLRLSTARICSHGSSILTTMIAPRFTLLCSSVREVLRASLASSGAPVGISR